MVLLYLYLILLQKIEEKRHSWENSINRNLTQKCCNAFEYIPLAYYGIQWKAFVNFVDYLKVISMGGIS